MAGALRDLGRGGLSMVVGLFLSCELREARTRQALERIALEPGTHGFECSPFSSEQRLSPL